MWTDVFQIFIMFAGLIAILIKGSAELGGFDNVWKYMKDGERVQFLKLAGKIIFTIRFCRYIKISDCVVGALYMQISASFLL